jgi:hypothetical protein
MWIIGDRIEPTGYMPAGDGYDVASEYDTVTINGNEYPLNCRFTLTGLDTQTEEPVYVSDSWRFTEPISIDEGLDNVRELLTVDSFDDLRDYR